MTRYADDLALAHVLADQADAIAMARFRALDLRVTQKPDLSPVTDADEAVEKTLRGALARSRPRDAVQGEELGTTGQAQRRWVIDPIDATKNFVRGVPIWATLIALVDGDEPVVGLVSAPALGRRWWAARGLGAFAGRHPASATQIHVSGVGAMADASFCYSSLDGWERAGQLDAMLGIMRATWRSRAYGDFYGYMLVAEGSVDIMVEPELELWDFAALIPIVTEAGGRFTDRSGGRPDFGGSSAVATNGHLHTEIIDRLSA